MVKIALVPINLEGAHFLHIVSTCQVYTYMKLEWLQGDLQEHNNAKYLVFWIACIFIKIPFCDV